MTGEHPAVSFERWPVPATPFSRQPWRALYIAYWAATLPPPALAWTAQWLLGLHPHSSLFTMSESLHARAIHRGMRLVPQVAFFADVLWLGEGPGEVTPEELNWKGEYKRTRVQWVDKPSDEAKWFKGHAIMAGCEPARIGAVAWAKPGQGPPTAHLVVGPTETVFLHLHGGGLTMGNATESYFINYFARLVSDGTAVDHVFSPEYRQLDQGPWPLPLVDCVTAYAHLVDTLGVEPGRIVLGGDSAGGLLVLALLRYLRDDLQVAEMPRAAVLISPLASVSHWLGPRLQPDPSPNRHIDLLNIDAIAPFIASCLLRTAHPLSLLDSPYLSPASPAVPPSNKLFARFPPCFVTGGGAEHYIRDVRELVRRLELGGVECEYIEGEGGPHDYPILEWYGEEKKRETVERMLAWVDDQLA